VCVFRFFCVCQRQLFDAEMSSWQNNQMLNALANVRCRIDNRLSGLTMKMWYVISYCIMQIST